MVFKNPLGIFGSHGPPQVQDPQIQHQMQMPLFNDFPLPAQQAAAAAQHPMLAPRPIDAATIGYSNYPPSDTGPSGPSRTINPQFHYPAPQVQPPQTWPTQSTVQDGPTQIAPTTVNHSQFRNFQSQASSGQGNFRYKQEDCKPEYRQKGHKQEADPQYPPLITNWANFPGQDFASASVPPHTGDTVWAKSYDGNLYPQVSIDPSWIYEGANSTYRRTFPLASYTITNSNMGPSLRSSIHPHNSFLSHIRKSYMWRTKRKTTTMLNPKTIWWIKPRRRVTTS